MSGNHIPFIASLKSLKFVSYLLSVLSSFLCNLYYGFNENELLDGVIMHSSPSCHVHCIVRVVDDFMFVSTEKAAVVRFLEKMHMGIPNLGINVNTEKSRCSFDFQSASLSVPKNVSNDIKGNAYFSWCGLLFNTSTGSVHIDYDRFSGGRAIDSLFLSHSGSDGRRLLTKMRGFIRPRALPLLYDLRVNTVHDIRVNYCQAVLLCAIKTHAYVNRMDGGYEKNPTFLLAAIEENLEYFFHTIRSRLKVKTACNKIGQKADSLDTLFTQALTFTSAKWLGLYLFASVLLKQTTHEHIMVLTVTSRCRSLNAINSCSLKMIADEAMAVFYSIYSEDS